MSEPELRVKVRERSRKVWEGARYASVGIEFGVSVVLGYLLGRWLDQRFGLAPWGTPVGVILGFSAALRSLLKLAARESTRPSNTTSQEQEKP